MCDIRQRNGPGIGAGAVRVNKGDLNGGCLQTAGGEVRQPPPVSQDAPVPQVEHHEPSAPVEAPRQRPRQASVDSAILCRREPEEEDHHACKDEPETAPVSADRAGVSQRPRQSRIRGGAMVLVVATVAGPLPQCGSGATVARCAGPLPECGSGVSHGAPNGEHKPMPHGLMQHTRKPEAV
jgi:hypothetical protein